MSIRIIKVIAIVFFVLTILCGGMYWGSRIERQDRATAEYRAEYVQTIAVVNLDEGIIQEADPMYYSKDFLVYPSNNFALTGLEDARQGVYQGRYAAYVIIPASFSRSIASINGIPQKAMLEYAVNPNLEEGIRSEAISDIQHFQAAMNTNIAYVYVSSILDEFHKTQDSSVIVLKNDKNELEKVSALEAKELLQELAFSELQREEYNLDDLDVDQEFAQSEDLLDRMGDGILTNLEEGQAEFENIHEQNDSFTDASRDLFDLLENITPGQSLSGEIVYEEGLEELERTIDVFHTDQALKRAVIGNRLYGITGDYRTAANEYLEQRVPQLQDEVDNQLNDLVSLLQADVDDAVAQIQQDNHMVIAAELELMELEREAEHVWIQNYIDEQLQLIFIDLKEIYEEDANQQLQQILAEVRPATPSTPSEAWILDESEYGSATPGEATPSEAYQIQLATQANAQIDIQQSGLIPALISGRPFSLKNAVAALLEGKNPDTDVWIALQAGSILFPDQFIVLPLLNQELYDMLAVEIEEMYHMSIDLIREVLQEQVIEEIEAENEAHKTEVELMMDRLIAQMDDYEESVDRFDPYVYVHLDEIAKTLNEVNQNISLIDRSVYEKTDQDRAFVDALYDLIDKNIDTMQGDMEQANEQTLGNILTTIEMMKTSRIDINQENTYLLEDFTRKLSYTRVGSMGNKEAYDFIVNPISMISRGTQKESLFQLDSNLSKYLLAGILLMTVTGGGTLLAVSLWIIKRQR